MRIDSTGIATAESNLELCAIESIMNLRAKIWTFVGFVVVRFAFNFSRYPFISSSNSFNLLSGESHMCAHNKPAAKHCIVAPHFS